MKFVRPCNCRIPFSSRWNSCTVQRTNPWRNSTSPWIWGQ